MPLASVPVDVVLIRVTAPVIRSLINISEATLLSPVTKLVAMLANITFLPSAEKLALLLALLASTCVLPVPIALTRVNSPVMRFLTKISLFPFASAVTKLVASLSKTTWLPSSENAAWLLCTPVCTPVACSPALSVLIRVIMPVV